MHTLRILTALAAAPLALTLVGSSAHADRPAPRSTLFDVSGLATGAPPGIVWSETVGGSTTIHGAAGAALEAPVGPVADTLLRGRDLRALAPMGSGYVVQQGNKVRFVAADGTPGARSWRSGPGLAVSRRGEAVAFGGPRGKVTVIDSGGDRVLRMPRVPARGRTSAAGVIGEDCKEDRTSNGCTVFANSNRRPVSWLTSSHGIVETTSVQRVSTVRGRWLGGITKVTDTGTCSAMMKDSRTRWRTCRNRFSDIALRNDLVIGLPAYGDGFGPTTLDLLDVRTGAVVHSWTGGRRGGTATYFDEVWEDSTHVLVVTFQDEEWAIVRLGLDGSMEYAVPPRADGGLMTSPFRLQTR